MAWTTPGTATAGNVLTAAFWNEQVRDQMLEIAPVMSAWTDYSSSVTFTNFTKGSATVAAKYLVIGKLVVFRGRVTLSGSTMSTDPQISLPVPVATGATDTSFGSGIIVDSGTRGYAVSCGINGFARLGFTTADSSGNGTISATAPFTWANNDVFAWTITYERS